MRNYPSKALCLEVATAAIAKISPASRHLWSAKIWNVSHEPSDDKNSWYLEALNGSAILFPAELDTAETSYSCNINQIMTSDEALEASWGDGESFKDPNKAIEHTHTIAKQAMAEMAAQLARVQTLYS